MAEAVKAKEKEQRMGTISRSEIIVDQDRHALAMSLRERAVSHCGDM
jgi:hypothetical protein